MRKQAYAIIANLVTNFTFSKFAQEISREQFFEVCKIRDVMLNASLEEPK